MTRFSFILLLCAAASAQAQTELSPPADPALTQPEKVVDESGHSPSTMGFPLLDSKNLRTTSSAVGTVGLLNVGSADLGQIGLLRFSVTGAHSEAGNFPLPGAQNNHTSGNFSVAFTPLPWLEGYLSYAASTNTNSASSPNLIQALGDLSLGAKFSRAFLPGVWGAVDLRAQTFSAVGSASLGGIALGFSPRLVGTFDARPYFPNLPLRAHLNAGFILDQTGALVASGGLNAAETYALGMNQYQRFAMGLGVEAPLPYATPFAEYGLQLPLGAPGSLLSPDGRQVSLGSAMPQLLSIGAKVTAVADLTLLAALNVGLSREVGMGIPATDPVGFTLGASFNTDPFRRKEVRVVERTTDRPGTLAEAKKKRIGGMVVDARTKKPLEGVIVSLSNSALLPVATEAATGRFLTHEIPVGKAKLHLTKEGFKPADKEVVVSATSPLDVEIALEPVVRAATFTVQVSSKKKPVASKVSFRGAKDHELATDEGTHPAKLEMPAGKYTVEVAADGYLAQTRDVQVSDATEMNLAFDLQPEPKKKLVVVKENKIQILQPVHFATAKATILPDSYNLLDQVVDAIVKANIKRLRVEGHTDNRGPKKANLSLSEDRARAVGEYLVRAGIDLSRVETAGHGDSKPVAPNLTARGRELNRRVEFVILER